MARPDLFDNDEIIPDDDYHEELGVDYFTSNSPETESSISPTTPESLEDTPDEPPANRNVNRSRYGNKRFSIKPMPAGFKKKFPQATSILMTNKDGTQILLVSGD